MEKYYNPKDIEKKCYDLWENAGAFKPTSHHDKNYTIAMPPPNITGSLHMGHALNNNIQDILTRFHRMREYNVLWQPGTDHASIATQMVVERKLAAEKKPNRHVLGREKIFKRDLEVERRIF